MCHSNVVLWLSGNSWCRNLTLRPNVSKQNKGCSDILNNTLNFEMWADHCKSSLRHIIFCFSNHQVQCKLCQMWYNISVWSASWLAPLISTHTPHIYGCGLVLYIIGNSTLLLTQFQTTFPSLWEEEEEEEEELEEEEEEEEEKKKKIKRWRRRGGGIKRHTILWVFVTTFYFWISRPTAI